jgi:hypothetical protein
VFNRVALHRQALTGDSQPTLESYQSTQWTAFAFGMLGQITIHSCTLPLFTFSCEVATLLAIAFFRGVGVIGYQKNAVVEEHTYDKP